MDVGLQKTCSAVPVAVLSRESHPIPRTKAFCTSIVSHPTGNAMSRKRQKIPSVPSQEAGNAKAETAGLGAAGQGEGEVYRLKAMQSLREEAIAKKKQSLMGGFGGATQGGAVAVQLPAVATMEEFLEIDRFADLPGLASPKAAFATLALLSFYLPQSPQPSTALLHSEYFLSWNGIPSASKSAAMAPVVHCRRLRPSSLAAVLGEALRRLPDAYREAQLEEAQQELDRGRSPKPRGTARLSDAGTAEAAAVTAAAAPSPLNSDVLKSTAFSLKFGAPLDWVPHIAAADAAAAATAAATEAREGNGSDAVPLGYGLALAQESKEFSLFLYQAVAVGCCKALLVELRNAAPGSVHWAREALLALPPLSEEGTEGNEEGTAAAASIASEPPSFASAVQRLAEFVEALCCEPLRLSLLSLLHGAVRCGAFPTGDNALARHGVSHWFGEFPSFSSFTALLVHCGFGASLPSSLLPFFPSSLVRFFPCSLLSSFAAACLVILACAAAFCATLPPYHGRCHCKGPREGAAVAPPLGCRWRAA